MSDHLIIYLHSLSHAKRALAELNHLIIIISWPTLGGRVYSQLLGIGSAYGRVTVWLNIFLSLVIDMLVWSFSKLLNVAWADCCLITDGRLFQRRMVLGKKE